MTVNCWGHQGFGPYHRPFKEPRRLSLRTKVLGNFFNNFCSLFVEDGLKARGKNFCPPEILNSKSQIRQMIVGTVIIKTFIVELDYCLRASLLTVCHLESGKLGLQFNMSFKTWEPSFKSRRKQENNKNEEGRKKREGVESTAHRETRDCPSPSFCSIPSSWGWCIILVSWSRC